MLNAYRKRRKRNIFGAFKDQNYVWVDLEGIPLRAYIDTGANRALVNEQVFLRLRAPISGQSEAIRHVGGESLHTLGSKETQLTIQQTTLSTKVSGLRNLPYDLILDRNTLRRLRAEICMGDRIIRIKGKTAPMIEAASIEGVSKITCVCQKCDSKENKSLREVINNFDWGSVKEGALGKVTGIQMEINTGNAKPIRCKPRRLTLLEQKELDVAIEDMLRQGVIRPSNSPWAAPIKLVPKPDGTMRPVISYVRLNDVTLADAMPLPHIDDLRTDLGKAKHFTKLDLYKGFWQIPVKESDKPKTAFVTHKGLYEFNFMPFGLRNGPPIFQRLVNTILSPLLGKGVHVYVDDILIYSEEPVEHLRLVKKVIWLLRKANLRVNWDKCEIGRSCVEYLGMTLSAKGLHMSDRAIQKITALPPPTTPKEMTRFLALTGYYRRFIPGYGKRVYELRAHARSECPTLTLTDVDVRTINNLKRTLTSAPLLKRYDPDKELIIETDACGKGIGAVLSQVHDDGEHPVEFWSKALDKAQAKWCPRELEGYAVIQALLHWRHWCLGKRTILRTDHESLKYVLTADKGKLGRWNELLREFDLIIEYKAGSNMGHVDYISRAVQMSDLDHKLIACPAEDEALDELEHDPMDIRQHYREDPELSELANEGRVQYTNGVWSTSGGAQYIPHTLRPYLLMQHHAEGARHHGVKKMVRTISGRWWWPRLEEDAKSYVAACKNCSVHKTGNERRQGIWHQITHLDIWEELNMDVAGPIRLEGTTEDPWYVIVMVDGMSRWLEAIPTKSHTDRVIIDTLTQVWAHRYGYPKILRSDNAPEFRSTLLAKAVQEWGATHTYTPVYHPEGNGIAEACVKRIKEGLRMRAGTGKDMACMISEIVFNYRTSYHETLGMSPYEAVFGKRGMTSADLRYAWAYAPVESHHNRLSQHQEAAKETRIRTRQEALDKRNEGRQAHDLVPGDEVYRRITPFERRQIGLGGLAPKFVGPIPIETVEGGRMKLVGEELTRSVADLKKVRKPAKQPVRQHHNEGIGSRGGAPVVSRVFPGKRLPSTMNRKESGLRQQLRDIWDVP